MSTATIIAAPYLKEVLRVGDAKAGGGRGAGGGGGADHAREVERKKDQVNEEGMIE